MAVFELKHGDTGPILEAVLYNPDGSVHDLTGSTAWKLHIKVDDGVVTRDMVKQGLDTAGTLRYSWTDADWTGTPGLPTPPTIYPVRECPMEYEVIGGTRRMTFPNGGYGASYDTLRIVADIA